LRWSKLIGFWWDSITNSKSFAANGTDFREFDSKFARIREIRG
jgi:hypothetical protein